MAHTTPAVGRMIRRNRAERERDNAFSALIATPHVFDAIAAGVTTATNFQLPARARLAMAFDAALDPEDVTVTMAGADMKFSNPSLLADTIHRGSVGGEGATVSITRAVGCPPGAFTLYVVDAQGLHLIIGTATFS